MFPPYVMDYHHTDPDIKDNAVGNMISGNAPVERVLQEINKCILVCANCHRMLHYAEGD
jgi:hypothetical protein